MKERYYKGFSNKMRRSVSLLLPFTSFIVQSANVVEIVVIVTFRKWVIGAKTQACPHFGFYGFGTISERLGGGPIGGK